jgi:hypothetical protein
MQKSNRNRLRDAGNIPQETLDYLRDHRRAENEQRAQKIVRGTGRAFKFVLVGAGLVVVLLIGFGLLVFAAALALHLPDKTTVAAKPSTAQNPQANPPDETRFNAQPTSTSILKTCNIKDADFVLAAGRKFFDVEDDGSTITYTARTDDWEVIQPKMERMIEAMADADACKHQMARLLVFKDPHGQEVGIADPVLGIRYPSR